MKMQGLEQQLFTKVTAFQHVINYTWDATSACLSPRSTAVNIRLSDSLGSLGGYYFTTESVNKSQNLREDCLMLIETDFCTSAGASLMLHFPFTYLSLALHITITCFIPEILLGAHAASAANIKTS